MNRPVSVTNRTLRGRVAGTSVSTAGCLHVRRVVVEGNAQHQRVCATEIQEG